MATPSKPAGSPWPDDERFRLLVEGVKDYAIFMLDPEGHVLTWNAGAERIKQYQADEIIGRHFSVFYPDEDARARKCEPELITAAAAGRFEEEGWRVRKDGSRFWASVVISAVRDATGRLIGFTKVTRDLTARREAEEKLRQSELGLRQLLASIKDHAVIMLDPQGHVSTWNAGAERITGYRMEEIVGKHFSAFYPADDAQTGKCEMELEAAASTGRFEEEGWRVRKDGSRFWANVVVNAVRSEDNVLVGFSKVTRDLTERRRLAEAQAAQLAAEQASRTKDEFLAMLGHELRNPLAPIVTALELMRDRCGEHSGRELQVIDRQVRHMVRLVDDLLDVSRLARGKIEITRARVDLRGILARAAEIATPLLEQRRHHFELDAPTNQLFVRGDDQRLVQVFANLLTNAARYTDPGGHVRVTARADAAQVLVEVTDDGNGISSDLLPRIFDLFVQGHQSSERASGGLGIGLTLVRTLVQLHGGSVEARTGGVGSGSTFVVRLPADVLVQPGPGEAARDEDRMPRAARACRILLVDDNEDACQLCGTLLGRAGHEVMTAPGSVEALQVVKTFRPDVAVLDIGLPVMDGYELGVRLRERFPELKMVALTGYGQPNDRARSSQAGFERHLVKPIDMRQLLASIDEVQRS